MTRWILGPVLMIAAGVLAVWLDRRKEQPPLARQKRESFLKDLTPQYRVTQPGRLKKQWRVVERRKRSA